MARSGKVYMKLSNIRPNFTDMSDPDKRNFFWNYAESRENDFTIYSNVVVKIKKSSPKEPKLTITPAQLDLLRALGLC